MSQASRETFREIKERGLLSKQRFDIYRTLWKHEPEGTRGLTHNEINFFMCQRWTFPPGYRHNIVSRLCELEKLGCVCRVGRRRDRFTKTSCTAWRTIDSLPVKPKQKTPLQIAREKFKRARARFIKARDRYLKLKALAGK